MESRSGSQQSERRVALWLGLAALLAYLPFVHGHFTGTDEMGVFLTTRALYEEGSFEVRRGPHRFKGRDGRTYAHPLILRAVTSEDAMTADWARLPYEVLERISSRVINEVDGINRVAYDISSKPPATIEWE